MKKTMQVTNRGQQEVKAIHPQKPAKAGVVKSGGDLRQGLKVKKGKESPREEE